MEAARGPRAYCGFLVTNSYRTIAFMMTHVKLCMYMYLCTVCMYRWFFTDRLPGLQKCVDWNPWEWTLVVVCVHEVPVRPSGGVRGQLCSINRTGSDAGALSHRTLENYSMVLHLTADNTRIRLHSRRALATRRLSCGIPDARTASCLWIATKWQLRTGGSRYIIYYHHSNHFVARTPLCPPAGEVHR